MSTTIDNRVVEMRFNNRDFERNANTTMSTLDKLKGKLNFTGAVKGLEELDSASKKLTFKETENGIEKVKIQFDALYVIGTRVFERLTDAAINLGKRLVNDLALNQVTAGWSKYEEKTSAVQTIMASTGKTIEEVNEQLESLAWFSDETSYSFTDMTNNVGKFTAAGVQLDEAVTSMKGIATWAARSGAGVQGASRAMYNLAQSLGAGYVKLMDWKSIELANMATVEFKNQVLDVAEAYGVLKKAGEDANGVMQYAMANGDRFSTESGYLTYKNFSETLANKWFSTDILNAVLQQYGAYAGAIEHIQEVMDFDTASQTMAEIDRLFRANKFSGIAEDFEIIGENLHINVEEAKALYEAYNTIGPAAFRAAQEAKTFSEAMDATRDATSSQWTRIFEYIFGDYQDAKKLWTDLANELWTTFAGPVSDLADMMYSALYHRDEYNDFLKNVTKLSGKTISEFEDTLVKTCREGNIGLSELGLSFDEVIAKYGSLEKAAEEGDSFRTIDDLIAQYGSLERVTELGAINVETMQKALNSIGVSLSDNMLEAITGKGGRAKLLDAIYNIVRQIKKITGAISEAWNEVFGIDSETISGWIDTFYNFGMFIQITDEYANNLKETFKTVFSLLGSGLSIIRTFLRVGINIIGVVLSPLIHIAEEVIFNLSTIAGKVQELFSNIFRGIGDAISSWWEEIKQGDFYKGVSDFIDKIGDAFHKIQENIRNWFRNFSFDKVGDFFSNIVTSFLGAVTAIANSPLVEKAWTRIKNFGNGIVNFVNNFKMPSLSAIQSNIMGFFDNFGKALQSMDWQKVGGFLPGMAKILSDKALYTVKTKGNKLWEWLINTYNKVSPLIGSVGNFFLNLFKTIKTIVFKGAEIAVDKIQYFGRVILELATLFATFRLLMKAGDTFDALSDFIKSWTKKDDSASGVISELTSFVKSLAVLIGVIVAAVYVLGQMNAQKLQRGLISMAIIFGIVGFVLTEVLLTAKNVGGISSATSIGLLVLSVLAIAAAIGIMANALKEVQDVKLNVGAILVMAGAIIALLKITEHLSEIKSIGSALSIAAFATSLKTLIDTIVYASKVNWADQLSGIIALIGVIKLLTSALGSLGGASGTVWASFGTVIGLAIAIRLIIHCVRLLGSMDPGVAVRGMLALSIFSMVIKSLANLSTGIAKANGASVIISLEGMLGVAALLLAIAGSIKILGEMNTLQMVQGLAGITVVIAELTLMLKFLNHVGLTLRVAPMVILVTSIVAMVIIMAQTLKKLAESSIDSKRLLAVSGSLAIAIGSIVGLIVSVGLISKGLTLGTVLGAAMILGTGMLVLIGVVEQFKAMDSLDASKMIKQAEALAIVFAEIAVMTAVVAGLGLLMGGNILSSISIVSAGLAAVAETAVAMATVVAAVGALGEAFGAEAFDKGVTVFTKVGTALGGFFGGLAGGAKGGFESGYYDTWAAHMPSIAENLSGFGEKIKPFTDFINSSSDATTGNKMEQFGTGINKLLTAFTAQEMAKVDTSKLVKTGNDINGFGLALAGENGFFDSLARFPEDASSKLDAISAFLTSLQPFATSGGLDSITKGTTSFANLGKGLSAYGKELVKMTKDFTITDEDFAVFTRMQKITELLTPLLKSIPTWSLLDVLVGDGSHSWSTLSSGLTDYGSAITSFVGVLRNGGITEDDISRIKQIASASSALAAAQNDIGAGVSVLKSIFSGAGQWDTLSGIEVFQDRVKGEGVFTKITSPEDSGLVRFAKTFKLFIDAFKDVDLSRSEAVIDVVKKLTERLNGIDLGETNTGLFGMVKKTDMEVLSDNLEALGTGLKGFSDSAKDIDEEGLNKFKMAITALGKVKDIKEMSDIFPNVATDIIHLTVSIENLMGDIRQAFAGTQSNISLLGRDLVVSIVHGMRDYLSTEQAVTELGAVIGMINSALNSNGEDGSNFVITPVVDMTNIEEAAGIYRSLFGNTTIGAAGAGGSSLLVSALAQSMSHKDEAEIIRAGLDNLHNDVVLVNDNMSTATSTVVLGLSDLQTEVANLKTVYKSISVLLDSNVLAGKLAPKIDKNLGYITAKLERYSRGNSGGGLTK